MLKTNSRKMAVPVLHAMLAALLIAACAGLTTSCASTSDAKKLMDSTNARGCLYSRASATPWAQATIIVVGTWGENPPTYAECWQGLPAAIP